MNISSASKSIPVFAIVVVTAQLVASCASHKKEEPWRRHSGEPKWYQSDMSPEDRSFFIDSFFHGGSH